MDRIEPKQTKVILTLEPSAYKYGGHRIYRLNTGICFLWAIRKGKRAIVSSTLDGVRRTYKTYINTEDDGQISRIETEYMAPIIEETGILDRWNNDTSGHL